MDMIHLISSEFIRLELNLDWGIGEFFDTNNTSSRGKKKNSGHPAIMVIAPGLMQSDENKGNIQVTRRISSCHIVGTGHFKVKLKQNLNLGGRNDDK